MLNKDYKEMLQLLLENEVEFLVVGAYALGVYGYPRATGDIDIWVMADAENSKKMYKTLKDFGAPLAQIDEQTFTQKGVIFQIGVAPRRIDIITCINGIEFAPAYKNRKMIDIDGMQISFISKNDLILNKLSTGRDKDRLDAEQLKSIKY